MLLRFSTFLVNVKWSVCENDFDCKQSYANWTVTEEIITDFVLRFSKLCVVKINFLITSTKEVMFICFVACITCMLEVTEVMSAVSRLISELC